MPTYEYRCARGHSFERVQKITARPIGKCPVCGAKAERIISGGQGLIFKGSGFYITDYGRDGKGPRKESEGTAAPAAEPSPPANESKAPAPAADTASSPKKKANKADVA